MTNKIDATEKQLEDYKDVFADIVNVLLFDGEEVVKEDELVDTPERSIFKVYGQISEQERDSSKFWEKGNVNILLWGLENQTHSDSDISLRIMSYEGALYEQQVMARDEAKKQGKPLPQVFDVATIVLYYGLEPWTGYKSSKEILQNGNMSNDFLPYINDYQVNVFEIAFLDDETIKKFKSDFRIVAEYLSQMRKNNDYIESKDIPDHVDAVLKTLGVLGDSFTLHF